MPAVDAADVVDAFDVFDAQPARSLRRSCVFGAIDQLDRFFYFLSVRVEVVNNLTRRAYAAGAA